MPKWPAEYEALVARLEEANRDLAGRLDGKDAELGRLRLRMFTWPPAVVAVNPQTGSHPSIHPSPNAHIARDCSVRDDGAAEPQAQGQAQARADDQGMSHGRAGPVEWAWKARTAAALRARLNM
jgi:hypothetical protein